MQIVIEISEDDYKEVKEDTYSGTPFENRVFSAIAKGTPLNDILDKIEAEIKEFSVVDESGTYLVNQIIDKYKGKSDCHSCKTDYDCYECKKYEESEVWE